MKRFLRILLICLLLGVLLLVGGILYLKSSAGQDFVTKGVNAYLKEKLKTQVSIQKIRYNVPDWISMEGVYVEDLKHDTLLVGSKLRVDMDMMKLLHNEVAVNKIEVENTRLNIKRTLPDSVFNYDFILKAFASPEPQKPNTAPIGILLKEIKGKNLKISFKDDRTGNDARLDIKNIATGFDAIEPSKSKYHLSGIKIEGISTNFHQSLAQEIISNSVKKPTDTLDIALGKIQVSGIDWKANLDESGIESNGKIEQFDANIDKIYLNSQFVSIKSLFLANADIVANLGQISRKNTKNDSRKIVANNKKNALPREKSWTILANDIQSKKLNLRFDDATKPIQKSGLDYGHILAKNINFDLENLKFANSTIVGKLKNASMTEKSGLVLQDFRTDFQYSDKETSLKNFFLKTPQSLVRDEFVLQYKSVEQFGNDLGNIDIKAKITNSQLSTDDILLLVPTLIKMPIFKQNPHSLLKFDGILAGKVNDLGIQKFSFDGFGSTNLQVSGRVSGLPTMDKMAFDMNVNNFSATKNDLLKALPDSLIPKNIELPEHLKLLGTIKGKLSDLALNATIITDFGNASYNGTLTNMTAKSNQSYDGKLILEAFDVGKLMKMPDQIGKVTLNTNLKGVGIDPKTAQASINGTVQQVFLKGYDYKNLALSGNLSKQIADLQANLQDENATLKMTSHINLAEKSPAVQSKIEVVKLDLKKLNLYADTLSMKGNIAIDLTSADAANPIGSIDIKNAVLNTNTSPVPIQLKGIKLAFQNTAEGKLLRLNAPFLQATMQGDFEYNQLKDILMTEINKYFSLPDTFTKITKPHHFLVKGFLKNDPFIQTFLPKLTALDSTNFVAMLNNQQDTTLKISAFVPFVQYDSTLIRQTKLVAFASGNELKYSLLMDKVGGIGKTVFEGNVANNLVNFKAFLKDSLLKNQYSVEGNLASIENKFRLKFHENVLLNYQTWEVDSTGFIQYSKEGVLVNNFIIQQKNQKFRANSTTNVPNSPIRVEAVNLTFPTLLKMAQQDTLMAGGVLNGNFLVSNLDKKPLFTGEASIKDFVFTQNPIGDLKLKSYNESSSKINVEATLQNDKNDVLLTGDYSVNSKTPLNFDLLIRKLDGSTLQAFSFEQLKDTKGSANGALKVTGTTLSPNFNGDLLFKAMSFRLTKLGSMYKIDNEKLHFVGKDILLNKFNIVDSLGQKLLVNGKITIAQLTKPAYDLNVQTKDFMALNSLAKDNDFFYGKGFFDTNVNVKGVLANVVVDGTVKVQGPSQITVVMPNDVAQKENADGIVMFVNKNGEEIVAVDTTANVKDDAFNAEVSLNIESDEKSEMIIVIDPLNGDNIKVRGNAQLTAGRTAQGENYIFGSYDIVSGTYELTYQLIKKGFKIQKGSNIVWTGDPMQGSMNITANYEVDAAPYDLMVSQGNQVQVSTALDEFKKKIPFNVSLILTGSVSHPQVKFDLKLPENNILQTKDAKTNDIENVLEELKKREDDLNKQVFWLLATNAFLPDQATNFFTNLNPEAIARQSVSKLLSDQMNQLAGNLIKSVKLDLNLNSTAVESQRQTDLMVGLSKGFLDNRLTVSVGRNFELENSTDVTKNSTEIFDNVSLNYSLTKDGKFLFKAYRKNEYQAVLDGFVVSTGLSFRVVMDFDKFKEMIKK